MSNPVMDKVLRRKHLYGDDFIWIKETSYESTRYAFCAMDVLSNSITKTYGKVIGNVNNPNVWRVQASLLQAGSTRIEQVDVPLPSLAEAVLYLEEEVEEHLRIENDFKERTIQFHLRNEEVFKTIGEKNESASTKG